MMNDVMVYKLDNNGNRMLDESGNPIVKIFPFHLWGQIKKFKDMRWEFVKEIGQAPPVDAHAVKITKISPKKTENDLDNLDEKEEEHANLLELSVANLKREELTKEQLQYIVTNDTRKSAISYAKEKLEK